MRELLTGQQMREVDQAAIKDIGIPSLVLMERAAMAVSEEVLKRAGKEDIVWCACGCGNNGADGVAVGRLLSGAGMNVVIVTVGDRERGSREFLRQVSIAQKLGLNLVEYRDFIPGRCDILVDAVFGVGLSRSVEGEYKAFLEMLGQAGPKLTVAVDVPSGISSDNGRILGTALKADVTVTFGWEKLGTALYPGKEYAGEVVVADIGFPRLAFEAARRNWPEGGPEGIRAFAYGREDLSRIPKRRAYSNKGTFGKALIVAGSKNMGGAAYLSALAAYRTGAGLVKILTVEENRSFLQARLPEAILETYDCLRLSQEPEAYREILEKDCEWADVVVLGPGLGQEDWGEYLVEMVLSSACTPVIVDADGLNIIAANPHMTGYFTENIMITPHLGEMARLTGETIQEIREDLILTAQEYASRFGITCVLKDAVTVAALRDGRTLINASGNSAMAKAGSGDVLTGIMAGLIAQGMDETEGAAMGDYLHGLAGDCWCREKGAYSLLAGELADAVGLVLKNIG